MVRIRDLESLLVNVEVGDEEEDGEGEDVAEGDAGLNSKQL